MIYAQVSPEELVEDGPLTPYAKTFARMMGYKDFDPVRFFNIFRPKVQKGQTCVHVAFDEDGYFHGCCMVNVVTNAFTGQRDLVEIMWGSSQPGVGRRLRELSESWGKERGCVDVLWGVTESPFRARAEKSLEEAGYALQQTMFKKRL